MINLYKGVLKMENENLNLIKEFNRVLKGSVFIYDIDENKDKKQINTTKYDLLDYTEYGSRPWVVVSDNQSNTRVCTIAPLSTGQFGKADKIKTHVDLCLNGKNTCIMVEQMRFVNAHELKTYLTTLNDDTMRMVDDAMRFHLGLQNKINLSEIDSRIKSIVDEKVKNIVNSAISEDILNDIVHDAITTKLNVNTNVNVDTKVDSAVVGTGDIKESTAGNKEGLKRGRKPKYTRYELECIVRDYKMMTERDFCTKYDCKDHKSYIGKHYYAKNLLKNLNSKK